MGRFAALKGDWNAIDRLLDALLEQPPASRAGWIASLSGDDARHADTLSRLLAASQGAETSELLARPAFFAPAGLANDGGADEDDDDGQPAAGATVGPWRLVSLLGQGGMGTVWRAERLDAMPRREVALKLPHLSWSPSLARRLARERDILATLAHPHIARLYDAGVDAVGRPWLALELVEGVPIDRWCAAHGAGVERVLGLVLQVADAVAHAHTRLVVHRDLKPSNILVSEAGAVTLLDFGVAMLLEGGVDDGEALTRVGATPHTPGYASPEQRRGEVVGTPSDVYSLGVVAHELLAGARLWGDAKPAADAVAPPASRAARDPARARRLRGDLDAILGQALHPDASQRYPTASAFADDVRRHLAQLPVRARPDRLGYRVRRFAARHAWSLAGGSVVAVALVAGAGVALWQAREARFEAARAEEVKQFVLSLFGDASTESGAGATTSAVDLLNNARARLGAELRDRPDVAVELKTAIAFGLLSQGRAAEGESLAREAVAMAEAALPVGDPRRRAAGLVVAQALVEQDRAADGIALLVPLAADARARGDTAAELRALEWKSTAEVGLTRFDDALASAEAAVAVAGRPGVPAGLASAAWSSLATARRLAQRPGAVEAARRGLDLLLAQEKGKPTMTLLDVRAVHASALAAEGRPRESLAELQQILDDTRVLVGDRHRRFEVNANALGTASLAAGDADGAERAFRAALASAENATPRVPYAIGLERYSLGVALAQLRRDDDAAAMLAQAANELNSTGAPGANLARRAASVRALSVARLGRLDEAERDFAALDATPWSNDDGAANRLRRAWAASRAGRADAALPMAEAAVAALSARVPKTGRAQMDRLHGEVLLAAGRPQEAVAPLRAAAGHFLQQAFHSAERHDAIASLAAAERAAAAPGAASTPVGAPASTAASGAVAGAAAPS